MKNFFFSLIIAIVLPLVLFLSLEVGLYLTGYGHTLSYFRPVQLEGEELFQDNYRFGLQFFPPALNRQPLAADFRTEPAEGTFRIFILGGSAARGFPDPDFGFGRLLESALHYYYPDLRVEVINTAMTAINSHAVYEIAKAVSEHPGNLAIVLLGNNEVVGPFGPGTVFHPFSRSTSLIRASLFLRRTRLGQLVTNARRFLGAATEQPRVWRGMELFAENTVSVDDPRLTSVYTHFRTNLADIVATLKGSQDRVLVTTVPVNLRDTAPFASLHGAGLDASQLAKWERAYREGVQSEARGDCRTALSHYLEAAELDDRFADLPFRMGRCSLSLGELPQAQRSLSLARDCDTLRFRADRAINAIIKEVASGREAEGIYLLDLERVFSEASRDGLPGHDFFYEHVHFNFSGNYLIAMSILPRVAEVLPGRVERPELSEEMLKERVAYPSRNTEVVLARFERMMSSPPFSGRLTQAEELEYIRRELERVRAAYPEDADRLAHYRRATEQSGRDWRVRFLLASELLERGRALEAERELDIVLDQNPHLLNALRMKAQLLRRRGDLAGAQSHLERALHYVRGQTKTELSIRLQIARLMKMKRRGTASGEM